MKNVILGLVGIMLMLGTVVISLNIYSINVRRNAIDASLSQILYSAMDRYYVPEEFRTGTEDYEILNRNLETEIREDLKERLQSEGKLTISILQCDVERGIISVRLTQKFSLLNAADKTLVSQKTVIVDREASD